MARSPFIATTTLHDPMTTPQSPTKLTAPHLQGLKQTKVKKKTEKFIPCGKHGFHSQKRGRTALLTAGF